MVRLKNRYLLVNILYPDSPGQGAATNVADFAAYHQPTTDSLTAQKLLKAIRHEVDYLFGDYGAGAIADSLLGIASRCLVKKHWSNELMMPVFQL